MRSGFLSQLKIILKKALQNQNKEYNYLHRIINQGNEMNRTAEFFNKIDEATKKAILENISQHYGITQAESFEEITDADAENLIDYITGPTRLATSALMQKHGCK